MSKRYGRNQRRKHREQIAELERSKAACQRAIGAVGDLLAKETRRHDALRADVERWEEDIRDLLGNYSAFNRKAGSYQVSDIENVRRLPNYPRRLMQGPLDPSETSMAELESFRIHQLVHFLQGLSDDTIEQMRSYVYLRLVEAKRPNEFRYAITDQMLAQDAITTGMVNDWAHTIARDLRELIGRRNHAALRQPAISQPA